MSAGWQKGMDLTMNGRNDKGYRRECKKLEKEVLKRREKIIKKHKNDPPVKGMALSPEAQELSEVSKYFSEEFKKIKAKYKIE